MTRVAVVQLDAAGGPDAAIEDAVAAVEEAAARGAELVVLPEYSSGWAPTLGPSLAVPKDGAFVDALRGVARRCRVGLIAGIVTPGAEPGANQEDARSVNLALIIGPDGTISGDYAKVHLFDAFGTCESDALRAGDPGAAPAVIDVSGLRFGVLTCYDLRFPESARRLADAGSQVLVVIAAWASGPGKVEQLRVLARARAIENTSYLLLASQHGEGRAGHSAVIDPLGVLLAEAGDDAAVLVADLDDQVVRDVRARVPVLAHRRYGVVPLAPLK